MRSRKINNPRYRGDQSRLVSCSFILGEGNKEIKAFSTQDQEGSEIS